MIARVPNRIRTQKRANDTNFVLVAMSPASLSSEHASVSVTLRAYDIGPGFGLFIRDNLPCNLFPKKTCTRSNLMFLHFSKFIIIGYYWI